MNIIIIDGGSYMNYKTKIIAVLLLQLPLYALTLPEAVEQTLESNPQMQKSISDYIAVENDLDIAKSGWRPTLDFRGAIGEEHTEKIKGESPNTVLGQDKDLTRKELGLIANQNLFEGFATQSDIKEQEARVNASRYTAMQDANSIGLRTTEVYLQVIRQKKILDLLLSNVKTHERIYKMIKQKTESGLSRRSDLEQTRGRLALAYANYISQQNNYQDAMTNFERVYGTVVSSTDMSTPELPLLPASNVEGLKEVASKYSPTLIIQQSNIKTQESRLEKDKKGFYPTLDLELSADWNEDLDGQKGEDESYQAMLRLNYNLYGGGNDESTRIKNLQLVTSEKEAYNEQQRAVNEKIRLAYTADKILANQIRCLEVHTKQTRQTADSYAKEYQLGRRTLLDLLNTELEFNNAQQSVINALYDRLYARYRILEATGTLPYILQNSVAERVSADAPDDLATVQESSEILLRGEVDEFMDVNLLCEDLKETKQARLSLPKHLTQNL